MNKKIIMFSLVFLIFSLGCTIMPNNKKQDNSDDAVRKAFRTILSGDFYLIDDDEYKYKYRTHLESMYFYSIENGESTWKYVLMDFNNDGVEDLFVQYDSDYNSGFFRYLNGKVKYVYDDTVEANCFIRPLRDGSLFEVYNSAIISSKIIFKMDEDYERKVIDLYFSITIDDYEYDKERFDDVLDNCPNITKEGKYYFYQPYDSGEVFGEAIPLSEEEWKQAQKKISNLLIRYDEFLLAGE
jgi:hypothetical protein